LYLFLGVLAPALIMPVFGSLRACFGVGGALDALRSFDRRRWVLDRWRIYHTIGCIARLTRSLFAPDLPMLIVRNTLGEATQYESIMEESEANVWRATIALNRPTIPVGRAL